MPYRKCSRPGCERKHKCRGYCHLHWFRWYRGLTMDGPSRQERGLLHCAIAGCTRMRRGGGQSMCRMHYSRLRRGSQRVKEASVLCEQGRRKVYRVAVNKHTYKRLTKLAQRTGRSLEKMTALILDAWAEGKSRAERMRDGDGMDVTEFLSRDSSYEALST